MRSICHSAEELRRRKELDSIGGVPYLASLSEGLPRKLSIESYVRIVRDKSLMRQLMTVCDVGMIDAADQSQMALDVLNNVSARLVEISEHAVTGGFSDITAIVRESFGSIDALYEQGREVTGLATHYIEFDRMTSGLQESRANYYCGAAFDGKDGVGDQYCGECGGARRQGGCGVLAGNEQGESAAENAGFAGDGELEERFKTGMLMRDDRRS